MDLSSDIPRLDAERIIQDLNNRYAECLDDDRIEEWPEHFTQDGIYKIHPRENYVLGLEGYWLYFDSAKMMRDRVLSLREANIYNIHVDRHIITNIRIATSQQGIYTARANYVVLQTNNEGKTIIFSTGEYMDKVVFIDGTAKFKERVVIPDTYLAISLIAVPL
jgi:anthranilate 1,2-dioxygenase small subunit